MLKFKTIALLVLSGIAYIACKTSVSQEDQVRSSILDKTIEAHGGQAYLDKSYSFNFRDKQYSFRYDQNGYIYTSNFSKNGQSIKDQLINGIFKRQIDNKEVRLSQKQMKQYKNSLNSVLYFTTLPYKLKDPSVIIEQKENISFNDNEYFVLQVNFKLEGGGDDHDDTYLYWIDTNDYLIDYLAYNYHTGKGGVRFRQSQNRRKVDGVIFQDYINYKAPKGTNLYELPVLFARGQLEKLSTIENKDITSN